MARTHLFVAAALAAILASCGGTEQATSESQVVEGQFPAVGASANDKADHACAVVLRSATRLPGGDDYQKQCEGDACTYVWTGNVEVSKDAYPAGATVGVLYHLTSDSQWWDVTASASGDGRAGFWGYSFTVSEHLFGPGLSDEQLAEQRIELVPYIRLDGGTRLFDHNRRAGDLDNYVFGQSEYFSVGDDGSCQAVAGTLTFQSNFETYASGTLHQNGWLSLWYDLNRLPECRGTHNGAPAWDLEANVQFQPGGQLTTASVRQLITNNGTPTNEATGKRLDVKIPAGATSVAIWFRNYSGAGSGCEAWDSNYGANYQYPVLPDVSDPRCQGIERWTSIYGGTETCLAYTPDAQFDATNCEFYLSGIGNGYQGHYGIPFQWLEAYLHVSAQQGELLNAGMLTLYTDAADGAQHTRISLGTAVDASTFKTGFTYLSTGTQGTKSWSYTVNQLAFFVDVRRPTGEVVRLWQSRQGANYSWDDAFGAGTTTSYIAYGNVKYAVDGAGIFDNRRSCQ